MPPKKESLDRAKINQLLSQVSYFDKDSSGPLGMEERLRLASYNSYVFSEIIKELIKE